MICVSSVNVSPSSISIVKGSWYYNLGATVYPTNATCNEIRWYSNNTSVASVNASTGYVYGVEPGTAIIYAVATDGSGATDYCTVTVTDKIYVSSVSLDKTSLTLEKDTGYSLQASVYPWNADNRSLSWNSSNSAVASVSGGFVCARSRGSATITATATDGSGVSVSCYVTVTDYVPVTSIVINTSQLTMDVGDEAYLHAVVCPENASNDGVVWDSSNLSVVSVDSETGKVTAVGPGNAVIYAIAKNESNVYNVCYVTVNQYVYVDLVEITPPNRNVKIGDTGQLTATVCPENATNTSLIWHSSNPEVLEIGVYTGNYKAKAAGTAIVSATATDGSDKSACCIVTVEENSITIVDCVTVSPENLTMYVGTTGRLIADVCLASGTDDRVYWYSADSTIVEVNSDTGEISAKAEGTVRVWAVSAADNSKSNCCTIEVKKVHIIESVVVSPIDLTINVGATAQLNAAVCPASGTDDRVYWYSADSTIVEVNPDTGEILAKAEGTVRVWAASLKDNSKNNYCTIRVVVPVKSIVITSTDLTMDVRTTKRLTANIYPENATNDNIFWSSTNPEVATIDFSGLVEAKLAGTTIITAKTIDGATSKCTITVKQALTFPDTLINNNPTRESIIKLKNIRDEVTVAYLKGEINFDAMEKATQQIDYQINLVRADYIAVGNNPLSDYAYEVLGGNRNSGIPCSFNRSLYYREENPFVGLDVMVVQRVLELYGYYDHDSDIQYGIWDESTQEAALSFMPLLSVKGNNRIFDSASFNVLFQTSNISKRTYDAMTLLQQFNLQHKEVQNKCLCSLTSGGRIARIEMPIKGGSVSGRTGRADLVAATINGTYVWEVKHNTPEAITAGNLQIQRYIAASQANLDQPHFYPSDLDSSYRLPLIPGENIFVPKAVPWFDKYLLYKSNTSINPYTNALIVYEVSNKIPDGYVYEKEPSAVESLNPAKGYSFSFKSVYNSLTNYGEAKITGMQIDPQTGEVLLHCAAATVTICVALAVCSLVLVAA